MAGLFKFMQNTYLYPTSISKKEQIVNQNKLLHVRMNSLENWVSIEDALGYLWPRVYEGQKYATLCDYLTKGLEARLPRATYIKACWPSNGESKEEFLAMHVDNLHLLFDESQ